MTSTFTPGQTVTASRTGPFGTVVGTPFVVAYIWPGTSVYGDDEGGLITLLVDDNSTTLGWSFSAHDAPSGDAEAQRVHDRLSAIGARGWNVRARNLSLTSSPLPDRLRTIKDELWPGAEAVVNLHPLSSDTLRTHSNFTLRSKPGTRDGNTVVFGCQRFSMESIADARGSMDFRADGVIVTIGATATEGGDLRVADRTLSRRDVNDWTTTITGVGAPTPVENAVVMEHGYYGCSAHEGEVLHLFISETGETMIAKIGTRSGRPGGAIGVRSGLADSTLRECRPVKGSTTAFIMNAESARRCSLVPITDRQRRALTEGPGRGWSGLRFGTLSVPQITRCTPGGALIAEEPSPF